MPSGPGLQGDAAIVTRAHAPLRRVMILISRKAVDIPALYDAKLRYGGWNYFAIGVYVVGILIQLPFIVNPLFHGSLTWLFAGNDVSWAIGWFGTAFIYYALRGLDRRRLPKSVVFPLHS